MTGRAGSLASSGLVLLLLGWLSDPASAPAIVGVIGATGLAAAVSLPRSPALALLPGVAFPVQLAVAHDPSTLFAVLGALALAGYLAADEVHEHGLGAARTALLRHLRPIALAAAGAIAAGLVATAPIGGVSAVTAIAVAASLSVAALLLALRDQP
jgi:hypothetical protein